MAHNHRGSSVWIRSLLIVLCATGAGACAQGSGLITQAHGTMGSEVRVTMRAVDRAVADESFAAVFAEFDRLDALLSVWKPESDVLRINAAAGKSPVRVGDDTIAVLEAARQRFRPIVMTSIAFTLGVLPLVLSTGAGANGRNAIGATVIGGTIASTVLGILFAPLFYVLMRRLLGRKDRLDEATLAPAE